MIRKLPDGKYRVESRKGRNLGTYKSRTQAEDRLKEVEMFKHMKQKKQAQKLKVLCRELKINGEDELADKIACALSALAGSKRPRPELTYSYVMRKLRKDYPEKLNQFQIKFKDIFDDAMSEELDSPEELALMAALKEVNVDL